MPTRSSNFQTNLGDALAKCENNSNFGEGGRIVTEEETSPASINESLTTIHLPLALCSMLRTSGSIYTLRHCFTYSPQNALLATAPLAHNWFNGWGFVRVYFALTMKRCQKRFLAILCDIALLNPRRIIYWQLHLWLTTGSTDGDSFVYILR